MNALKRFPVPINLFTVMMVPQDEDCMLSTLEEENGPLSIVFSHQIGETPLRVWMCIMTLNVYIYIHIQYILNQVNELAGCVLGYRSLG